MGIPLVEVSREVEKSQFKGTIIDIETIGEFDSDYRDDSREYASLLPVILGCFADDILRIYYVEQRDEIKDLERKMAEVLPGLEKPFYAFNSEFETGVFFHSCGKEVRFDYELNQKKYESKRDAVRLLGINNYDDPFNDDGRKCKEAWLRGEVKECIRHNRSCLLKERDILLMRGSRKPDNLTLVST